jgi:hypothetical protein
MSYKSDHIFAATTSMCANNGNDPREVERCTTYNELRTPNSELRTPNSEH